MQAVTVGAVEAATATVSDTARPESEEAQADPAEPQAVQAVLAEPQAVRAAAAVSDSALGGGKALGSAWAVRCHHSLNQPPFLELGQAKTSTCRQVAVPASLLVPTAIVHFESDLACKLCNLPTATLMKFMVDKLRAGPCSYSK